MRFALLLRGMAYCKEYKHPSGKRLYVDYRKSVENYKEYIIRGNDVDVFYHTYYSDGLDIDELNREYRPKAFSLSKDTELSEIPIVQKYQSCVNSLMMVLNTFYEYCLKNDVTYDYIILTRFDLLLKIKLRELPLEKNKFNISCMTENKRLMDDNFFVSDAHTFQQYLHILCNRNNSKMLHFDYENMCQLVGLDRIKILVGGNYIISHGTPVYYHVRHQIEDIFLPDKELIFFNYKTKKYMLNDKNSIRLATHPSKFKIYFNQNGLYNIISEFDNAMLVYDPNNNNYIGTAADIGSIMMNPKYVNKKYINNGTNNYQKLHIKISRHKTKELCWVLETENKKYLCSFGNKILLLDKFSDSCLWLIY